MSSQLSTYVSAARTCRVSCSDIQSGANMTRINADPAIAVTSDGTRRRMVRNRGHSGLASAPGRPA